MNDMIGAAAQNTRIDSRILKHLLREATDLLEEGQTHALVEKQGGTTAYVLSRTNWRMTATCLWAIGELFPVAGAGDKSAQLHSPVSVFPADDDALSPQMSSFVERVDRLHERARRLDDLSRGPVVSSQTIVTSDDTPAASVETRPVASVIPLFGNFGGMASARANPVEQTRSKACRAMVGHE